LLQRIVEAASYPPRSEIPDNLERDALRRLHENVGLDFLSFQDRNGRKFLALCITGVTAIFRQQAMREMQNDSRQTLGSLGSGRFSPNSRYCRMK
jgi:hypothetical protein